MKKKITDYLIILLGLMIVAFSISTFIAPNKIIQGGISGVAVIIYYMVGLPMSLSNLFINIILIALGIKILKKDFIIKTVICIFVLSGFLEIFSYIPAITQDKLLASIFGGVLYGFGIGLTLIKGASSGGTDIVGRIFQHFIPHMPIGKLLLIIDGLVIVGGYIAFRNFNLVMYGILTIFISTFCIDYLIKKLNVSKLAFIVSEKGQKIADTLISTSPRGVTKIDVVGGYTNKKTTMLVCAIKENEMPEFQKKIDMIDKDAFTIFSESQQIVGNGFHVYK